MKDYASMSDVDVARMVSAYLWGSVYSLDGFVLHSETSDPFDPCNNPADAWPIITSNLISVEPDYEFIDPSEEEIFPTGLWVSVFFDAKAKASLRYADESPLRAAMIVFLMMKEGEK